MKRTDPRHGTPNGYGNQMCRCDRCRVAWRKYRIRLAKRGTSKPRRKARAA